ncbi:MAG: antitoxin AF2212-like protein [Lentisphaerota bacterium]
MIATTAIYEKGAFFPLKRFRGLREGAKVHITVASEKPRPNRADDILNTAFSVFEGLSGSDINEIEKVALDRKAMFGRRK